MQSAEAKALFLREIAWGSSWGAALARHQTYAADASDQQKLALRRRARQIVEELSCRYRDAVSANEHESNIAKLSALLSNEFRPDLGPSGFKVGTSQKLLNLYLKFLWCLGEIPEPPHCPLDRIIQTKAKVRNVVNWSQIATIEQYRDAICSLREAIDQLGHGDMSLAQWEVWAYGPEAPISAEISN